MNQYLSKYRENILFYLTSTISLGALIYFFLIGQMGLMNYDAYARLNIARKVVDNLTPGVGQLGGMWLPLPHVLLIPLVWYEPLWHSGIAGAFVSTVSFVIGALFLEKTTYLITKSAKASFFAWFIFVTNQNNLLFQTTPMSESFFLCTVILILFFFTKWVKTLDTRDLLGAAVCVMFATLTRYEGYFVLGASFITVIVVMVLMAIGKRKEEMAKIEGTLVLFITIAAYGIFLWCMYCLIFFKDPLYWLHFYSKTAARLTATPQIEEHQRTILGSLITYADVSFWMAGLIVSALSLGGIVIYISVMTYRGIIKKKVMEMLPMIIILVILFPALVYGHYRKLTPGITYPFITWENIWNKSVYVYTRIDSPNVRYGLTIFPFMAFFAAYFASRNKILYALCILLVCFQIYTVFYTPLNLQFSIPVADRYKPAFTDGPEEITGNWIRNNCSNGLTLVSASQYERMMYFSGMPYKKFIHEGTRQYWDTSLDRPDVYAECVVIKPINVQDDRVLIFLTPNGKYILETKYKVGFDQFGYKVYKKI